MLTTADKSTQTVALSPNMSLSRCSTPTIAPRLSKNLLPHNRNSVGTSTTPISNRLARFEDSFFQFSKKFNQFKDDATPPPPVTTREVLYKCHILNV